MAEKDGWRDALDPSSMTDAHDVECGRLDRAEQAFASDEMWRLERALPQPGLNDLARSIMSDFSKLITRLITPAMRARGFRKHGKTDSNPLHGSAVFLRHDCEVRIVLALHPYDYPEVGIRLETMRNGARMNNWLYPLVEGGIEAILRSILIDIESGAAVPEPNAATEGGA